MKKLFTKKNKHAIETDSIAFAEASAKKAIILSKISLGINASTLIATPAAIKLITDRVDDDAAKKALYITGGLLWIYQLSDTINAAKAVKGSTVLYEGFKKLDDVFSTPLDTSDVIDDMSEMEDEING